MFWEAEAPSYFVTSSSPFLVAFPRREEEQFFTLDLRTPSTEITLPLTSRVALHATWKRRGELWRRVPEDALLEINFRTCQRARKFHRAARNSRPTSTTRTPGTCASTSAMGTRRPTVV